MSSGERKKVKREKGIHASAEGYAGLKWEEERMGIVRKKFLKCLRGLKRI